MMRGARAFTFRASSGRVQSIFLWIAAGSIEWVVDASMTVPKGAGCRCRTVTR